MSTLAQLLAAPPDLPVARRLDELAAAASANPAIVVSAPPGTGKTTLVPPVVAESLRADNPDAPRVLVTQPRRVAAHAAASRIASLLGEHPGETVGYAVRGERRVGPGTVIEMLTPGILVRRLQRDPELPGVGAIVFDEVHERHLDSDLALAFALDARATLREDLRLVAMSATVATDTFARLLDAKIVEIPGDIHPVAEHCRQPPRGAEPLGALGPAGTTGVRREFLAHVASVVREAAGRARGDVLVFLPGMREIDEVARRLAGLGLPVERLHGSMGLAEQNRMLSGGAAEATREAGGATQTGACRVVLATALAESSLTVPGVRCVVDAGLSRESRADWGRGVSGLVTVLASRASAIQRAGRAGREGPGEAYRCMSETTWARLAEHSEPEIRTADLADFALQAAVWGAPGGEGLALADMPPTPAIEAAHAVLESLGALERTGALESAGAPGGEADAPGASRTVTPLGRELATLPVGARIGRALVESAPVIGARRAAGICATLDLDVRPPGADLARLRPHDADAASGGRRMQTAARLERLARRFEKNSPGGTGGGDANGPAPARRPDAGSGQTGRLARDDAVALVVALAYPERLAKARAKDSRRYLLASGVGATLPENSPLIGQPWLAVAQLDQGAGRADALIRAAVPIAEDDALAAGAAMLASAESAELVRGRLRAVQVRRLGAIELGRREVGTPDPEAAAEWVRGALADGRLAFEWSEGAAALRERLAFLRETLGGPWPDVSDGPLAARVEEWAGPELAAFARGGVLAPVGSGQLERIFPWPEAARLGELAPERIEVPAGGTARVDYSGGRPIVRMRVQEAFGWKATPRIAGGRVPIVLELLSPARRPVAVTDDLASFWAGPYVQVRAEMRGRYPRHPWPEDPANAEPTRRAKPRR